MTSLVLDLVKVRSVNFRDDISEKGKIDLKIDTQISSAISDDGLKCKEIMELTLSGQNEKKEDLNFRMIIEGYFSSEDDLRNVVDEKSDYMAMRIYPYAKTYLTTFISLAGLPGIILPEFEGIRGASK